MHEVDIVSMEITNGKYLVLNSFTINVVHSCWETFKIEVWEVITEPRRTLNVLPTLYLKLSQFNPIGGQISNQRNAQNCNFNNYTQWRCLKILLFGLDNNFFSEFGVFYIVKLECNYVLISVLMLEMDSNLKTPYTTKFREILRGHP